MEKLLISAEDFKPYRAISSKINPGTQLEPFIIEAQRLDLLQMLGGAIYHSLISVLTGYERNLSAFAPIPETEAINPENPEGTVVIPGIPEYVPTAAESSYLMLLNGGTFESAGVEINYPGLKPVLVYLAFARYIKSAHIIPTQTGFKTVQNQYSEPISGREMQAMSAQAVNDAQAFMSFVFEYLRANSSAFDFPENKCGETPRSDPKRTRLGAVKGNSIVGRKRFIR